MKIQIFVFLDIKNKPLVKIANSPQCTGANLVCHALVQRDGGDAQSEETEEEVGCAQTIHVGLEPLRLVHQH